MNTLPNESSVSVLLVEDDEVDVMAVRRAFRNLRIANAIHVAHDGIEALAMLRGEAGRTAVPHPYLILLDLNMPRMNGLEFLEALREDPIHRSAIVFVLTTSAAEQDRWEAYRRYIAGYIVKSRFQEELERAIHMIDRFWYVVTFPA